MVENADSRPLIGRPSFDSTPLLIENRRVKEVGEAAAILLNSILPPFRRSGAGADGFFKKRPFLCLMLGLTFGY